MDCYKGGILLKFLANYTSILHLLLVFNNFVSNIKKDSLSIDDIILFLLPWKFHKLFALTVKNCTKFKNKIKNHSKSTIL